MTWVPPADGSDHDEFTYELNLRRGSTEFKARVKQRFRAWGGGERFEGARVLGSFKVLGISSCRVGGGAEI